MNYELLKHNDARRSRIDPAMDARLIDRIYESSFTPEAWPGVLHEMGQIAGTLGASLFVAGKDVFSASLRPSRGRGAEKMMKEGWLWRGAIIARLFAERHPGF